MMKKNNFFRDCLVFFLCVMIVFVGFQSSVLLTASASSYYSSAKGCVVMETTTKRKLYAKNENQKMPMASTTKIMTAITAIENCDDLDEEFEVSPKAVGVPGTSLYLRKGDVYSTRELLYALMLISGNDASVAIAEHVAGSTSEFVTLMNGLAKNIGATSSHFANTHGLDADGHYTTAYDLALITSYALENETFRQIVSTKNTKITNGDGTNRYLKNKNKLLFTLDGCVGVKTGYTDDAGRCLVSAIEKDGMRLVCVVLNCRPMFEESATLLKQCVQDFKIYDLTEFYDFNHTLAVLDGKNETARVGTKSHFLYPLSKNEVDRLKIEYSLPENLRAPLEKDSVVGKVKVFLDNNLLFCEKIFTIDDIKSKTLLQRMKDFFANW